jgi:predicted AAA+ superfamily ATPase
VFPLSFREVLNFRGIEIKPYSAENESLVRGALEAYLAWGGFPEIATDR